MKVLLCLELKMGMESAPPGVEELEGLVGSEVLPMEVPLWMQEPGLMKQQAEELMPEPPLTPLLGLKYLAQGLIGEVLEGLLVWMMTARLTPLRMKAEMELLGGQRLVKLVQQVVMGMVGMELKMVWNVLELGLPEIGPLLPREGAFGKLLLGHGASMMMKFGMTTLMVEMLRFQAEGGQIAV